MSNFNRRSMLILLIMVCVVLILCAQSWVLADEVPFEPPLQLPPGSDSTLVPPDTNNLGPHGAVSPGLSLWDVVLLVESSLVIL